MSHTHWRPNLARATRLYKQQPRNPPYIHSGPLPLLFVDTLFKTHPNPTLRPRAVALISFYLLAWSPLFWNYGYSLLVPDRRSRRAEQTLVLSKKDVQQQGASAAGMTAAYTKNGAASWVRLHRAMTSHAVRQLLNPPTLGCTLGAVAGLVPPVRRYDMRVIMAIQLSFVSIKSQSCPTEPSTCRLFLGEGAPLSSLFEALRTMGAAYVPCVLLVLAGSLAQGLEGFDAGLLRRTAVVMGQRFLIMPALTVALVAAGKRAGVIPAHDPLLVFILLLQGCMPNAQNSVLILQLEKRPQAAASMARLTSTVYVLSILPIGILLQAILSRSPLFQ